MPRRDARTHRMSVRVSRRSREERLSRIKWRLTIVHSVSRHHRVSSAAAGPAPKTCAAVPGNLRPSSEKRAWNPVEPPRWLLIVIINGIMT